MNINKRNINSIDVNVIRILLLLFLSFFITISINSQDYDIRFDKISKDDGLSNIMINDICQDSIGFLWFATEEGLNRYDGYDIKIYKHDPADKNSIRSNIIRTLYVDKEGLLWIGTEGGGVNLYDPVNDNFTCYTTIVNNSNTLSNNDVYSICEDYQGFLWFGTKSGLNKFDKKTNTLTRYISVTGLSGSISNNLIYDIFEDRHKNLWIGTSNGLNKFIREQNKFINYKNDPDKSNSISNNYVHAITEDSYGYLWLATEQCVNRMNIESENFISFKNDTNNSNSIADNNITSVYNDRSDNLWIGTSNGGLSKYNFDKNNFSIYKNNELDPFSISGDYVKSIYQDKSGILWVGTYNAGINKYDPEKHHFQYNLVDKYDTSLVTNGSIKAICKDKYNNFWFGTDKGLSKINSKNGVFKLYKADAIKPDSYSFPIIYSIYEDSLGELWFGSNDGLLKYDSKLKEFKQYHYNIENPNNHYKILYITENQQGDLLLGREYGLSVFNRKDEIFIEYLNMDNQDYSNTINSIITDDDILWLATFRGLLKFDMKTQKYSRFNNIPIYCLHKDKFNNLWLGTQGKGLAKFDHKLETFTFFTEKYGLSDNTVYGILEDDEGDLWLGTKTGISKFNPESITFYNYYIKNNLAFIESNPGIYFGAYYKDDEGNFYFGSNKGFVSFNPLNIKKYVYKPSIVITDFQLSNKSVKINSKGILKKNIFIEKAITLPYKEMIFSFKFSALNYSTPYKNQYSYKLEGYDKDWNYLGNNRYIFFRNLNAGRYKLLIKGSTKDNIWNETGTALKIIIKPPLWRSWWAYTIYLILIVGSIVLIILLIMKRQAELYEEKIKTIKINQLTQINEQKTNFFINITHEIKTPITIIANYLDHHIQKSGLTNELKVVRNNLDKLIRDMTNYLDLEKLERGQIFYNHDSLINISKFISEKSNIFKKIAETKQIKLEKNIESDLLFKIDPDALDRILNNLLDNAIKYTENCGKIEVVLTLTEDDKIVLTISDNGIGISEDQQKDIFNPYYQISHNKKNIQGIGMGLNIVKKIVDELGGKIEVQKKLTKGTTFTLTFNYTSFSSKDTIKNYSGNTNPVEPISTPFLEERYQQERQTIFLIEDNIDMLSFLQKNFAALYNVYYALNGKQALNKIDKLPVCPDLILSDIMMDEMDGYIFYDILSRNKKYKNIPFIFLTARSNADDRLKGLSKGAVDFISKPFLMEEVKAKISSLLKIKKALELRRMNEIGIKIYEYINRAATGLNYSDNISIQEKLFKIKRDYHISDQELKVLLLLEQGLEYKEIADILNITINTVDTYRKRLFKKCNVRSKKDLLKIISVHCEKTSNLKN